MAKVYESNAYLHALNYMLLQIKTSYLNMQKLVLWMQLMCEDPDMRMPLIELEGNVRLNVTLILTTNACSYV